ncbi:MAG: hypothetical protein H6822_23020 [Planctomycetaceae bacterium]|nr:hypothetical protein [Planctomycetales bacterium]MCB9925069.1 hypothetical protein [Planctomycetaceae bacterium]
MCSRNHRFAAGYICRFASWLALAGVLASSLGIAVVPHQKKKSSLAYPCQGGSCGCSSAAQCWQNCCCTTPAERLAWAGDNDVAPPPVLTELLANTKLVSDSKSCCSHLVGEGHNAEHCVEQSARELPSRFILLSDLNRCRGMSTYIAVFGGAICEPLPDGPTFDATFIGWLRPLNESLDTPLPSPPTPPPRLAT